MIPKGWIFRFMVPESVLIEQIFDPRTMTLTENGGGDPPGRRTLIWFPSPRNLNTGVHDSASTEM